MPVMQTITGEQVDIKVWTDQMEYAAFEQMRNLAKLPIMFGHIAAMPDVHMGKGAAVGSVLATKGAIIPSAVGVDIGCVDKDTEFLSPNGWIKISEYSGQEIMQFDPQTGLGSFINPISYIKLPCQEFIHFKTKYGIDQMLSDEHRMLIYKYSTKEKKDIYEVKLASEVFSEHSERVLGFRGRINTSFYPNLEDTSLPYSDEQLRVIVMVMADAHLYHRGDRCIAKFRKDRKIERCKELLASAGIEYYCREVHGGATAFSFTPPLKEKSMIHLWRASLHQLRVIVEEALKWDGHEEDFVFFTKLRESADFMHYAMTAVGKRSTLRVDRGNEYRVFGVDSTKVGFAGTPKTEFKRVPSEDGFKYCFTVPTGFWVMRRNANIAVTGNCGMVAAKTTLKATDLPDSLKIMRAEIERGIPLGAGGAHAKETGDLKAAWKKLDADHEAIITKHPLLITKYHPRQQLGTLGSGNHFIEICLDENDSVWIMLHSGSRGIGNLIGQYFISKAKKYAESHNIHLPDKELAWLNEGTEDFNDYVFALNWAQDFAMFNRQVMFDRVYRALEMSVSKPFSIEGHCINCHHNYSSIEKHMGESVWLTRKGAVNAERGRLGIIPGSMGTKSYIVEGLGNEESFCSCSHGAGRRMSRSQAKREFTLEDLANQTYGVECRKDESVLDEIPGAYKDIDQVMANQQDLVKTVATLRQILCVKG